MQDLYPHASSHNHLKNTYDHDLNQMKIHHCIEYVRIIIVIMAVDYFTNCITSSLLAAVSLVWLFCIHHRLRWFSTVGGGGSSKCKRKEQTWRFQASYSLNLQKYMIFGGRKGAALLPFHKRMYLGNHKCTIFSPFLSKCIIYDLGVAIARGQPPCRR